MCRTKRSLKMIEIKLFVAALEEELINSKQSSKWFGNLRKAYNEAKKLLASAQKF